MLSKKTNFLILGISSLFWTKLMFFFFDDPEGPNLLVVVGMSIVIYFISASTFLIKMSDFSRFLSALLVQVFLVTVFYFIF